MGRVSKGPIKKLEAQNRSYLFFESQKQNMHIFEVKRLHSQFMRRIVARKAGKENEWNWRESKFTGNIAETIAEIKGEFP